MRKVAFSCASVHHHPLPYVHLPPCRTALISPCLFFYPCQERFAWFVSSLPPCCFWSPAWFTSVSYLIWSSLLSALSRSPVWYFPPVLNPPLIPNSQLLTLLNNVFPIVESSFCQLIGKPLIILKLFLWKVWRVRIKSLPLHSLFGKQTSHLHEMTTKESRGGNPEGFSRLKKKRVLWEDYIKDRE